LDQFEAFFASRTVRPKLTGHQAGKMRLEGRDYVVQDGDVFYFRFNV
jgi:ribosome-binding ATPase YchF (GTP1/OBG family)